MHPLARQPPAKRKRPNARLGAAAADARAIRARFYRPVSYPGGAP